MLICSVVGKDGITTIGVGETLDASSGVVLQTEGEPTRVGKASEQSARVAGGDAVAVGVLYVVEIAINAEAILQAPCLT